MKLSKSGTPYYTTSVMFKTPKGTFRLSATDSRNDTDEFKCVETNTFHTWKRKQIYEWYRQGKIEFVEGVTLNDVQDTLIG